MVVWRFAVYIDGRWTANYGVTGEVTTLWAGGKKFVKRTQTNTVRSQRGQKTQIRMEEKPKNNDNTINRRNTAELTNRPHKQRPGTRKLPKQNTPNSCKRTFNCQHSDPSDWTVNHQQIQSAEPIMLFLPMNQLYPVLSCSLHFPQCRQSYDLPWQNNFHSSEQLLFTSSNRRQLNIHQTTNE